MSPGAQQSVSFSGEELAVLSELLEAERSRLLVEIRHADHRVFREQLRHRLTVLEGLIGRFALA